LFYLAKRNTLIGEYQTMNSKSADRRINRTRKLLQEALVSLILEKGYEKVTVQNVIDYANVGRSTFYAHFQDMDDLLLSQFDGLRKQFDQHIKSRPVPATNPWELTLLMFQHAHDQRLLYKALIGERGGNVMLAHINEYFSRLIQEHLRLQLSVRNNEEIPSELLAYYIVNSFIALLTRWLDNDLPYSAERMNDIFRELMEHGVESVLEQSGNAVAQFEMLPNS
jgi:AcrR family transcriptional regulator